MTIIKFRQVLEHAVSNEILKRKGKEIENHSETYKINNKEVDENIFQKESNRVCLKTDEFSDGFCGSVNDGPYEPAQVLASEKKIIQYFVLPFYKK